MSVALDERVQDCKHVLTEEAAGVKAGVKAGHGKQRPTSLSNLLGGGEQVEACKRIHRPASCAHLRHVGVPHGQSLLPGQAPVHIEHRPVGDGACAALPFSLVMCSKVAPAQHSLSDAVTTLGAHMKP